MHDPPAISGARSWKIVECVESRKPRRDSRGGSDALPGQTGAKAPGLSGRLKNPGRRFGARDWKWPEKRLCRVSGKPRIAPLAVRLRRTIRRLLRKKRFPPRTEGKTAPHGREKPPQGGPAVKKTKADSAAPAAGFRETF